MFGATEYHLDRWETFSSESNQANPEQIASCCPHFWCDCKNFVYRTLFLPYYHHVMSCELWHSVIKKMNKELLVKYTNKDKGLNTANCQISPPHEYAALERIQADRRGDYWEETPSFTLILVIAHWSRVHLKSFSWEKREANEGQEQESEEECDEK